MIARPPVWVIELAERFWAAAAEVPPFPRDLRTVVAWLPNLHFVEVSRLTLAGAAEQFARRNIPFTTDEPDRPLSGCFGAHRDVGLILIDSAQDEAERRFALAHELAHYLRDYQEPRHRASSRLGAGVLEVLDGLRPPTAEERLAGVLRGVKPARHAHLLERDRWGRTANSAAREAEEAADRLAFELLVPFDALAPMPARGRETLAARLVGEFGLPSILAAQYAEILWPAHFPRKFVSASAKN